MISAKMIEDSVNPWGNRLSTILCRYPIIIHGEVMTHRDFSRNAASSRAIPVAKMITDLKRDPFVPVVWTKNQPGMQGHTFLNPSEEAAARQVWHEAMLNAIAAAETMAQMKVHKQIVNRLLMPFLHITVLISSTRWANFLALRLHKNAEPHMRILADHIDYVMRASVPNTLKIDDLHVPFVTETDRESLPRIDQIRLSVARCASTSYKTVDGFDMDLGRAKAIHDALIGSTPVHASPAEHVAFVGETGESGNFDRGWIQYRKTLPHERVQLDEWLTLRTDEDYRIHADAPAV